jgi:pyrroline-5-carboxylate reductase
MDGIGHLVVVGGGRMGEAIVGGLVASGAMDPDSITVVEPVAARRETLAAAHGVRCAEDPAAAVGSGDTVLFAVKPQLIDEIAIGCAGSLKPGAVVVSIAAGISSARLESHLPAGTAVVRVMPNTPALVLRGMSVVSGGSEASPDQVETVRKLFGAVGHAVVLDERHQNAATAISGSGPAYVALFVDALARAGVRHGLPRDAAQELALRTLEGTVELIEVTGQHPEQLVDGVTSPGGTTIAAVEALEAGGFRSAVAAAVAAAVARAKELEG